MCVEIVKRRLCWCDESFLFLTEMQLGIIVAGGGASEAAATAGGGERREDRGRRTENKVIYIYLSDKHNPRTNAQNRGFGEKPLENRGFCCKSWV